MAQTVTTENAAPAPTIILTPEQRAAFVRTVKIGYFKEFYHKGLITGTQLEMLIRKQDRLENPITAYRSN